MQPPFRVKYGSTVYLKHWATEMFLTSIPKAYRHPGTSGQQMVFAAKEKSEETRWLIKGPHVSGNNHPIGEFVANGDRIRLQHCSTKKNLHSQGDRLSPISKQQEVTCYRPDGLGDENDDWVVELEHGGAIWNFDENVRLIHAKTNMALHSHIVSVDRDLTNGEQEVTGFAQRDINDLWVVAACDQPADELSMPDTPSISEGTPEPKAHRTVAASPTGHPTLRRFSVRFACLAGGALFVLFLFTVFLISKKHATINRVQADRDSHQKQLEPARPDDMTVNLIITNSRSRPIQINPIGSMDITESFGGASKSYSQEPFRIISIISKDSESVDSSIEIPARESREFKFTMTSDKRPLFERGTAVLICTVFNYDGVERVTQYIQFNQNDLKKTKLYYQF